MVCACVRERECVSKRNGKGCASVFVCVCVYVCARACVKIRAHDQE